MHGVFVLLRPRSWSKSGSIFMLHAAVCCVCHSRFYTSTCNTGLTIYDVGVCAQRLYDVGAQRLYDVGVCAQRDVSLC